MTVEMLNALLSHVDGNDLAGAQRQLKAAEKADAETWAPLKPLLKTFGTCPSASSLLHRCLEHGGTLGAFAEAALRDAPREVWKLDESMPIKGHAVVHDIQHGAAGVTVALEIKDKIEVYALPALAHQGTLKVEGKPLKVSFVDDDAASARERQNDQPAQTAPRSACVRLRLMWPDGSVGHQRPGEKKATRHKVVDADADAEFVAAVAADAVTAFISCQVDDADRGHCSVVTPAGRVPLTGVDRCGPQAFSVGSTVYVPVFDQEGRGGLATVDRAQVRVDWLPRHPSGGTAPPIAEYAHQIAVVGEVPFLITWCGGASPHRWLRLPDLVEDERWGRNFADVDCHGATVWSGAGDRVEDGVRSRPIDWGGTCWRVMVVDATTVVALVADLKDKLWLKRFVRHTPARGAGAG